MFYVYSKSYQIGRRCQKLRGNGLGTLAFLGRGFHEKEGKKEPGTERAGLPERHIYLGR
jgi:hypothetical protein